MAFPYAPNYGGNWQTGAGGGTPITEAALDNLETQFQSVIDLLTTRGDIPYRGAATWERLAKGTEGYFLRQGANDPAWASITKEFFIPFVTSDGALTNFGDYPVAILGTNKIARCSFFVPNDFSAITSAVVVIIPAATGGTEDFDIYSDYAASGEAYATNSESDAATTYNVTASEVTEIDISGILSALAAGDYVGIRFDNKEATNVNVVGVRFKYS